MATSILFVCSGNICRSPLAEYLARRRWPPGDWSVSSAGIAATPGTPATPAMVTAGKELGVDLSSHAARLLAETPVPDLVLCMEHHHADSVRRMLPGLAPDRIRLLGTGDIDDPYGGSLAEYRRCAATIAAAIDRTGKSP
ncbi:MAG: low molecular weight phosphatase family protein [Acidimicrobiia bacterium]